jgi:VanZ family protein
VENSDSLKWRGRIIAYAPLILWIGVIFYLSSGYGSMSETSRFIRPLLKFLFPAAPEETLQIYHGYVRKCAHFSEYAILAFLGVRAFSRSSIAILCKYRYLLPFFLVASIACIDELNQSFEASRTGSVWDILLDISGCVAMIAVSWLLNRPQSPGISNGE